MKTNWTLRKLTDFSN